MAVQGGSGSCNCEKGHIEHINMILSDSCKKPHTRSNKKQETDRNLLSLKPLNHYKEHSWCNSFFFLIIHTDVLKETMIQSSLKTEVSQLTTVSQFLFWSGILVINKIWVLGCFATSQSKIKVTSVIECAKQNQCLILGQTKLTCRRALQESFEQASHMTCCLTTNYRVKVEYLLHFKLKLSISGVFILHLCHVKKS